MGGAPSRAAWPPASEVLDSPYELRAVRAPRLAGATLQVAVWLLENTWLGPLFMRYNFWKSNIPQMVRLADMPEPPTFQPLWPPPALDPAEDKASVSLAGQPALERAAAASRVVAGGATEARLKGARRGEDDKPQRLTIARLHAAYLAQKATPAGVAEAVLGGIAHSEGRSPPMRFLIACDAADVRAQAAASTARYAAGRPLSCLDGVPYAVIDGIDALPYPTTAGTTFVEHSALASHQALGVTRPVTADAPCIAALRAAGALLIGKANLHEVGVGMTGLNPHHGTARNPHNPAAFCGGSSSGSAALVAAGLCLFTLGIDGGGSVRVPAALCGVLGLRPTVGRTALVGSPENATSIMSFGPLAGCLADALQAYAVIANAGTEQNLFQPPPARLPRELVSPAAVPSQPLKGLRVGVYWEWFEDAQADVVAACKAAVQRLEELGAKVVSVTIPDLEAVRVAQILTIASEICQAYKGALGRPALRRQLALDTRMTMVAAQRFSATDYLQAQKIRTRLMAHFRRIFGEQGCDLVAAPTTGCTAPLIRPDALERGEADLAQTGELMRYTICVNMAGIPAASVPVGLSPATGLPVALQLMGRPWGEAPLMRAASALEAALPPLPLPPVHYDLLGPART